MVDEKQIGLMIAGRMHAKRISAIQLAEKADLSVEDIEDVILGRYELDFRTIAKLEVALDCIMNRIFHQSVHNTIAVEIDPPSDYLVFHCDKDTTFETYPLNPKP